MSDTNSHVLYYIKPSSDRAGIRYCIELVLLWVDWEWRAFGRSYTVLLECEQSCCFGSKHNDFTDLLETIGY
jgi:hypothetical protein